MPLTIISGERGAGKTTRLRQYVAEAVGAGRTVGGVAAPAVFEAGRRTGYDLLDLRLGTQRPLARTIAGTAKEPTIGVYHFDDEALAEGQAAIVAAVRDGRDVVAIDEVGPLELAGRGWATALEEALRTCGPTQELIIIVRSTLVDALPQRFPSPLWTRAHRLSIG